MHISFSVFLIYKIYNNSTFVFVWFWLVDPNMYAKFWPVSYQNFVLWISVEYNVSYVYHAMYAYFDRDNVRDLPSNYSFWTWIFLPKSDDIFGSIRCLSSRKHADFSKNQVKKKGSMLKNLWNTRFSAIHFILSPFEIPISFSSVSIGSVYRSLSLYSDEDQNKRGGKVKLPSMRMPVSEFGHVEKGDALYGKFFSSLVMFHSLIFSLSTP